MPAPGRGINSGPVHEKATGMTRSDVRLLMFALAGGLALLAARPAQAAEGNLLAGKAAHGRSGVAHADRLTDDRAAPEGDFWKTSVTASFRDADAFLIYDLGKVTPIAAAWLQGDNNDRYRIEVWPTAASTRRCGTPSRWPAAPGCGSDTPAT